MIAYQILYIFLVIYTYTVYEFLYRRVYTFFCCTIITQGWMTFASGLLIYLNNFISISGPTYMWKWMRHQKCLRACTPYIYSVCTKLAWLRANSRMLMCWKLEPGKAYPTCKWYMVLQYMVLHISGIVFYHTFLRNSITWLLLMLIQTIIRLWNCMMHCTSLNYYI